MDKKIGNHAVLLTALLFAFSGTARAADLNETDETACPISGTPESSVDQLKDLNNLINELPGNYYRKKPEVRYPDQPFLKIEGTMNGKTAYLGLFWDDTGSSLGIFGLRVKDSSKKDTLENAERDKYFGESRQSIEVNGKEKSELFDGKNIPFKTKVLFSTVTLADGTLKVNNPELKDGKLMKGTLHILIKRKGSVMGEADLVLKRDGKSFLVEYQGKQSKTLKFKK